MAQLSESQLQDVRFAVASLTATALVDAGLALRERAKRENDSVAFGIAVLASMSGETGLAAFELYGNRNWYAGAALTRQLVEHHHLFAYFSEDRSRVNEWLNADERQLRRQFAASKLREAGGFTNADYRAHCSWGGHPNPRAAWLVAGNEDPRLHLLMLDLVQHLGFIFSGMVKCIGEEEASAIPSVLKAYNYILKWREIDPLSKGLPVGSSVEEDTPWE